MLKMFVNTSPSLFANTFAIGGLTSDGIIKITFTLLCTVQTKGAVITFLFTFLTLVAGSTGTSTIGGIAGSIVLTLTYTITILAIVIDITRTITFDIFPTGLTEALASFWCTLSTILAVAFI